MTANKTRTQIESELDYTTTERDTYAAQQNIADQHIKNLESAIAKILGEIALDKTVSSELFGKLRKIAQLGDTVKTGLELSRDSIFEGEPYVQQFCQCTITGRTEGSTQCSKCGKNLF